MIGLVSWRGGGSPLHVGFALATLYATLSYSLPLRAQDEGAVQSFAGPAFAPAPDRSADFVTAHSGRLLPARAYSLGVLGHYAHDPLVIEHAQGLMPPYAGPYSRAVIEHRAVVHALGAYGVAPWLQLSADLPLVLAQAGDDRTGLSDPGEVDQGAGLGDVRVIGKLRLYDDHAPASENGLRFALVADVGLPTGDRDRYQGGVTRLAPLLAAEWSSSFGVRIAGNLGYAWRSDEPRFADVEVDSGLAWAVALELPVWPERLWATAEVFGDLHEELQAGLRARIADFIVQASAGPGLSQDTLSPGYRIALSAAYRGGTPEPRDADGDGVLDAVDRCPSEAEDDDDFADDDGCPDPDNDADGLPDRADRCPLDAEDGDRFEDRDGCPDPDNDSDGVVDGSDRCPLQAEDRDGFEDGDGCPDLDNDADGIADADDACLLDPEDRDGDQDRDGCPDIEPSVRVDVVLFFAHGDATLSAESQVQLDRIAQTLIAMPDSLHVWISGHADDTGKPEYNQQLGMQRAQSARQYLAEHGVPAERMTAQSYGDTKNLFVATGEAKRLANRNVEFRVGPRALSPAPPPDPQSGRPAQETK